MTLKSQDGSSRIRDILASLLSQWEEVETRRPSLYTVYGFNAVCRQNICTDTVKMFNRLSRFHSFFVFFAFANAVYDADNKSTTWTFYMISCQLTVALTTTYEFGAATSMVPPYPRTLFVPSGPLQENCSFLI